MKANLDRFLISGHLRLIAVLTGRVFFFSSLKSSQLWNPLFFIQQQLQFYPSFISAIKMSRLESDFSSSSTSELLPIPQINIIQNRIELLCYETPCVSSSRSVSSLASCFSNFSYKQKEGFFLQLRDSFYSSPISKAFGERLKPPACACCGVGLSHWEMRFRCFTFTLLQPLWAKTGCEASPAPRPAVGGSSVAVSHHPAMSETPLVDAHTAHLSEHENKTVMGCLKSPAGFFKGCGPQCYS